MFCICISDKDIDKVIKELPKIEMAEIRMDLMELGMERIGEVFSTNTNLIATCRPTEKTEQHRVDLLKAAISAGAKYVDIEIESPKSSRLQLIETARKYKCKIIISYHNFEDTPSVQELRNIVNECFNFGADIAKIACQSNSYKDSASLLSLYGEYENLVVLGMGQYGKITRVAAPHLGGLFTFVAQSETSNTAPGQLTLRQMTTINEILQQFSN